jgi:GntR family transcriptional regulator
MANPMYRRIADDLRLQIESGELEPGARLPAEPALQQRYGASRNTVRDAVRWLITRGLVETRPGQGTFVVEKIDPFVTSLVSGSVLDEMPEATVPRVEIMQAGAAVAAELQIPRGASVVSRHQRRFIDGAPYSLQTTFYPMRLVEQGATDLIQAQDMTSGAVRYLEEELGIQQAGWQDRITVRSPHAEEAAFFGLEEDGRTGVFETLRTGYDESGLPLRLTATVYAADRNEFVVFAGRTPARPAPAPGADAGLFRETSCLNPCTGRSQRISA